MKDSAMVRKTLRSIREGRNLSREEVGARVNLSHGAVYRAEAGRASPAVLEKVADALGFRIEFHLVKKSEGM